MIRIPHLSLHRARAYTPFARRLGIERLLIQHAFILFLFAVIALFIGFLLFFYNYFYRVVSGDLTAQSEMIHAVPKTVNLRSYQQIVEVHTKKMSTGENFSSGAETIKNPFVSH